MCDIILNVLKHVYFSVYDRISVENKGEGIYVEKSKLF